MNPEYNVIPHNEANVNPIVEVRVVDANVLEREVEAKARFTELNFYKDQADVYPNKVFPLLGENRQITGYEIIVTPADRFGLGDKSPDVWRDELVTEQAWMNRFLPIVDSEVGWQVVDRVLN